MRPLLIVALLALPALQAVDASPTSSPHVSWPRHYMPTLSEANVQAAQAGTLPMDADLVYHGGSVQTAPRVFLVFWGWFGVDPAGEAPYLIDFFSGLGGSEWSGVLTQYWESGRGAITNPTGQLAGVWWDDALPTQGGVPVLQENILLEVQRAVDHFGHHPDANYVIATPTLRNDVRFAMPDGFCAWHSWMTDRELRVVAFTNLPYIPDAPAGVCGESFVNPGLAGRLDGVSIVAGHEYAETITDPTRGGGWLDANGLEIGDKCVWIRDGPAGARNIELSTGTFAVQTLWSNRHGGCAARLT